MIVVRVIGGLGNQLFQYSFGKYLEKATGADVSYDISEFDSYKLHGYQLSNLNVSMQNCEQKELKPLFIFGKSDLGRKVTRQILKRKLVPGYRYIKESDFEDEANSLSKLRWSYMDGYWQRHKHLPTVRSELLTSFTPKNPIRYIEKPAGATVGVHIRRGDYANDPKTLAIHGILPLSYYEESFARLTKQIGNVTPIIFSDDSAWVAQNVRLHPNQVICKGQDTLTDFFNLSRCDHQIIANSTYSWWTAWLNSNPEKQVFAPKKWFAGRESDLQRLIPPEWNLI